MQNKAKWATDSCLFSNLDQYEQSVKKGRFSTIYERKQTYSNTQKTSDQ